jgi:hypothetical protein
MRFTLLETFLAFNVGKRVETSAAKLKVELPKQREFSFPVESSSDHVTSSS